MKNSPCIVLLFLNYGTSAVWHRSNMRGGPMFIIYGILFVEKLGFVYVHSFMICCDHCDFLRGFGKINSKNSF